MIYSIGYISLQIDAVHGEYIRTNTFEVAMQVPISNPTELGLVVRAARKAQGLRLDDAAAFAGVGPVFAGDVEHGKATVQLGLVLKLLQQLGLKVLIDAPDATEPTLAALRARGPRERRKRAPKKPQA
jgi:hypothetical protein